MKNKVEIVAHSLSPQGEELISVLCTFPRIILAEVNTHRMLSKNTSSSRAIPFIKMVESVKEDPFIPFAWQKHHSGMQGNEYITKKSSIEDCINDWLEARNNSIKIATRLNSGFWINEQTQLGEDRVTKQLCNRLLEPFMWTTMLITGSREGWDNFFHLRCPQYQTPVSGEGFFAKSWKELISWHSNEKNLELIENADMLFKLQHNKGQAEIHIMDLAEKIYDAVNESTPKQLKAGEWHIPFENKLPDETIEDYLKGVMDIRKDGLWGNRLIQKSKVKISTAMAARTSYTVVGDEKSIDYEKMIELHDRLLSQDPPHSSPLEHCARAMSDEEYESFIKGIVDSDEEGWYAKQSSKGWCNNFKGFIPYRYMIDNKIKI